MVVVYTEPDEGLIRIIGARPANVPFAHGEQRMTDIPELTEEDFERAIPARVRKRLISGRFESGEDIAALRRFVRLTQAEFARAIEISVHTLRNWSRVGAARKVLRLRFCGSLRGTRGSFART